MRSRSTGQSMVETALILPILLVVLFGIMEFGYYIYAYSSVSQAARNGAEVAAQLPPYPSWLSGAVSGGKALRDDQCVNTIFKAIESDSTLFRGEINAGRSIDDSVQITYPNGTTTRNLRDRGPIQITISYQVRGITPLFQLLGFANNAVTLTVTQRRSIENLGADPTKPQGVACAKTAADL